MHIKKFIEFLFVIFLTMTSTLMKIYTGRPTVTYDIHIELALNRMNHLDAVLFTHTYTYTRTYIRIYIQAYIAIKMA